MSYSGQMIAAAQAFRRSHMTLKEMSSIYGYSATTIKKWLDEGWRPGAERPGDRQFERLRDIARVEYFAFLADRLGSVVFSLQFVEQLLDTFEERNPEVNELKSTADIRTLLSETLRGLDNGTTSTSIARIKVQAARAFLDTVKVELAAAAFGKDTPAITFSPPPQVIEHKPDEL